jgi:hypothetical protein
MALNRAETAIAYGDTIQGINHFSAMVCNNMPTPLVHTTNTKAAAPGFEPNHAIPLKLLCERHIRSFVTCRIGSRFENTPRFAANNNPLEKPTLRSETKNLIAGETESQKENKITGVTLK